MFATARKTRRIHGIPLVGRTKGKNENTHSDSISRQEICCFQFKSLSLPTCYAGRANVLLFLPLVRVANPGRFVCCRRRGELAAITAGSVYHRFKIAPPHMRSASKRVRVLHRKGVVNNANVFFFSSSLLCLARSHRYFCGACLLLAGFAGGLLLLAEEARSFLRRS